MFSYIWPIALVVLSNVVYQICAKSIPRDIDPFASLTVTYAVGAIASVILYYATNKGGHLLREYSRLNWSPFVLGIVIVGLEVGFIYAYKAGWQVSTASIVQSSFLALAFLLVGFFLYRVALRASNASGTLMCMLGPYLAHP